MEDITFISILKENFPLILSTFVSVISIGVNVFVVVKQTSSERKIKSMDLYFSAQYKAYKELYEAAAELEADLKPNETRDIRRLLSAAKNAEMLSPESVVEVIDNFCAVHTEYVDREDNGEQISPELQKEFKEALSVLGLCLREELRRFNEKESKILKEIEKKLYK